ncbi:hypothetical protein PENTCL1PPCAC_4033, partial [Pristionchus entomophagus]
LSTISQKSYQVQDRLAIVFFLQIIAVGLFYVFPLLAIYGLMMVDTSTWSDELHSVIRPTIIIAFSLKPLAQSLIYLGKNPGLRKAFL